MCFSAQASFITSGLLSFIGIYTLQKIKNKSQIPFALIPIFFAAQQFIEGLIWVGLAKNLSGGLIQAATYIFLAFALPFWPLWIPISMIFMERDKLRRTFLFLTLFVGAAVAGFSIYGLAANRAHAQIISHHIFYNVQIPQITKYDFVLYLIATILPFFISSIRLMWFFGLAITASLIFTYFVYTKFLLSIWCFFAAALSVLIYLIVAKKK